MNGLENIPQEPRPFRTRLSMEEMTSNNIKEFADRVTELTSGGDVSEYEIVSIVMIFRRTSIPEPCQLNP